MQREMSRDPLEGLRSGGALQRHVESFVAELISDGYAFLTIRDYARSAAHLGRWMDLEGILVGRLTGEVAAEFGEHLCVCPGAGHHHQRLGERRVIRARRFVEYLRRLGVAPAMAQPVLKELPAPLSGFRAWMTHHRGVTKQTIDRHERLIKRLLPSLGEDPTAYDAALVRRILLKEVSQLSCGYARCFIDALRAFLRFLAAEERCSPHLDRAVPTIPAWRLSALPRFLEAADVERVIESCDLGKADGIRDRAVLLLLARLGLRAGDIVGLCLDDLDWGAGRVRVRGKGRKETRLPLPQDAGDAVLEYLEHIRPSANTDRVFLCLCASSNEMGHIGF